MERLANYQPPPGTYNEFRDETGKIRPQWSAIVDVFGDLKEIDLAERWQYANRVLQENGTNITGVEQGQDSQRHWELDLLPVVFGADQWGELSQGVSQRARLVEALGRDLYGAQSLFKEGILPSEVLFSNPDFERAFYKLPANYSPLLLYGCELARSTNGKWWVLADRASAPAGISYTVENRLVISKALSQVLHKSQICRLAPFFVKMQETIKQFSSKRKSNPTVVILSSGPNNPYYFEDIFLSRYLGYPVVEADDLTVRKNHVCLKTLEELVRIDVIIRRTPDQNLDPLELRGYSSNGISGLLQVIRNKKVVLANGLEYGLLDSPAIMPFLPQACRRLLGEELLIPSIATWWCGQKGPLEHVKSRFQDLVIKPAFLHSGSQEFIVSELTKEQQTELLKRIARQPEKYVAQEKIIRSTGPCWVRDEVESGHLALRTFAVKSGEGFDVMEGGLVRVQRKSGPMTLSISAGEFSKDIWVRSDKPVPPVTLLKRMMETPRLRRSTINLPSRAADNLFWLGRYLERFEFAGRQIRKVTERLLSESANQPVDDVLPLIMNLAQQGIIEDSYGLRDFCPPRTELELLWPKLVRNTDQVGGYYGLKDEVYRLGSLVRDRMSEDFWRVISLMKNTAVAKPSLAESNLSQLLDELNRQVLNSYATSGQIMDGLVHGPTRHFLATGRHLERSRQLMLIIKQYLKSVGETDVLPLVTLLDVCNSLMTYRSRYRSNFALLPVIDLIVTDPGNPHAIIFQFNEMEALFSQFPATHRSPQFAPHVDLIRKTLFELESILPTSEQTVLWEPYQNSLNKVLKNMEPRIKQVSKLLTQNYFVHAGATKQINDITDTKQQ